DVVEYLDQGTQTIAMCRNNDVLASTDLRCNHVVPVWNDTYQGVFQAFAERNFFALKMGVAWVVIGRALVVGGQRAGGNVKAAAPLQYLVCAVFCSSFSLVHTLQSAVVPFIEAPVTDDRN